MQLVDIYKRTIDRSINPAVVAQDSKDETVRTEINEYVFTDEIINNLYQTLKVIRYKDSVSKTGIWINGYYGSGKSHFLKYINYLIDPKTREKAFARLVSAISERDPFKTGSRLNVNNIEIAELKRWYDKADIKAVIFNAQDVSGSEKNFTQIFFNKFNELRGYNSYNIPLALLFEKYLDENNALQTFKDKLEEETNFDWDTQGPDVVAHELDTVLSVAKSCTPNLDTDSLKNTLLNPQTYLINITKLADELNTYIQQKEDSNFRLLFLVDEVSQFINTNKELLLALQTIVERVSDVCKRQVWIACTAQQTLDNLTEDLNIRATDDDFGKIMGRFETRVSLESTDPAYITQERLLSKKSEIEPQIAQIYRDNQDAIATQFVMGHELYRGYNDESEFVRAYPFLPYQFKLIAQVFDGFQSKAFVVKEVKDNERSILKITHETAKETKEKKLGYFVPFDAFFNNMMRQNLINNGSKAISPALELKYVRENSFAQRVVRVLFMISNLSEQNRQYFNPNLDNITLLLISGLDENKAAIKRQAEEVIHNLIDNNIIREEKGNYFFYNEDEAELSLLINNTIPSVDFRADVLRDILFSFLRVDRKFRDFTVSATVNEKHYYGQNGDIVVDFSVTDDKSDASIRSLSNPTNTLLFCIDEWFTNDNELKNNFFRYCRYEQYFLNNPDMGTNEVRSKSLQNFKNRNKELLELKIRPIIQQRFNETTIVSGQIVMDAGEITGTGAERYKNAMEVHLRNIYRYGHLTESLPSTQSEATEKANLPYNTEEYKLKPLSDSENMVNDYITRMNNEILLSDLLTNFKKAPYGWKDSAIIYIITELKKRNLRDITYRQQPRYPIRDFLLKAFNRSEQQAISITATEEIPQENINRAIEAWKNIFNEHLHPTSDGNALFETTKTKLAEKLKSWNMLLAKIRAFPFAEPVEKLWSTLDEWERVRDPRRLFQRLHDEQGEMATLTDLCKEIADFEEHNLESYKEIKRYMEINRDNLLSLSSDEKPKVEMVESFLLQDNPSNDFRSVIKAHNELKKAVNEKIKELKQQIVDKYGEVFDDLEILANEQEVLPTIYADREYTISSKTRSTSIAQLSLELERADSFLSGERSKILQETFRKEQAKKSEPTTTDEPDDSGTKPESTKVKEPPVTYKLPTAKKVLVTPSDVEEYIQFLREELMKKINENKTLIIE